LAFQRGDITRAMELMKRILAVHPKHPRAWTGLGFAQMARGEVEQGIASMRKQLEVTPEEPAGYEALAGLLMSMKRNEEAIQVVRGLLKAVPDNEPAAANLGQLLLEKKRYGEAATDLGAAAKLNPDSARIQQALGRALLETGSVDLGMQALEKAISLDASPPILNNVAYHLAEANRKLPEALRYAEQAVRAEEKETAGLDLNKLDSQDLGRVWRIATFWDTLGWVHFQMGNLEKAEQYLRAAWLLSQSPAVGDHLGQVYEKKGQRMTAARYYAMAVAAKGSASDSRERLFRILGMTRGTQAINRAREQLGRERTRRVKPAKAVKGSGEFFVLFGPGGEVEDAQYVSGVEGLRAAAASLRTIRFEMAIPPGSSARLLRRGILMCITPKLGCDFVLLTPDTVRSVD
jgi:tetratricopeptide (TPR) repeat protein